MRGGAALALDVLVLKVVLLLLIVGVMILVRVFRLVEAEKRNVKHERENKF